MLNCAAVTLIVIACFFSIQLQALSSEKKGSKKRQREDSSRRNALQHFDEVLNGYLAQSSFDLPDLVALASLYFLREDQFKQGGEVQSLNYTQLALKKLTHQCKIMEETTRSPQTYGHPCDLDESKQQLLEALRIHEIRMLILTGNFTQATLTADLYIESHKHRFGDKIVEDAVDVHTHFPLPSLLTHNRSQNILSTNGSSVHIFQQATGSNNDTVDSAAPSMNMTTVYRLREQRSRLYNSLGEALLMKGSLTDAFSPFIDAIELSPCMHHAYFQLARALQAARPTATTEQANSILTLSQRLQCRSEALLGGISVSRQERKPEANDDDGDDSDASDASGDSITATEVVFRPVAYSQLAGDNVWPDQANDLDGACRVDIVSRPAAVKKVLGGTNNEPKCVFGDELMYLEDMLRFGNMGPWHYAAHASAYVVRSALYWTLFHTAETLRDYELAWFYLQQGRWMERERLYKTARQQYHEKHRQPTQKQDEGSDDGGVQDQASMSSWQPFVARSEYWQQYRAQSQQIAVQLTRQYPSIFWPPHNVSSSSSSSATASKPPASNGPKSRESIASIESITNVSQSDLQPVFIVGFFRSGSTLLESLLESHPRIAAIGERSPFAQAVGVSLQPIARQHLALIQGPMGKSTSGASKKSPPRQDKLWQMEKQLIHRQMQAHGDAIMQQMTKWVEILYPVQPNGQDMPSSSAVTATSYLRIVDKMLSNYRHVGLIHWVFPSAIILHTIRDPIDTLLSCIRHRFADDNSAYTLDIESLVEEYLAYTMVMQHFRKVLPWRDYPIDGQTRSSVSDGLSGRVIHQPVIDIRTEMLMAHPSRVLHDLWRLLRVPVLPLNETEAIVATFHERQAERSVRTASFLQVKQPLSSSSVGQWRRYRKVLAATLLQVLEDKIKVLREHNGLLPYFTTRNLTTAEQTMMMNWHFDEHFDYEGQLQSLREYVEKQRGIVGSMTSPWTSSSRQNTKH